MVTGHPLYDDKTDAEVERLFSSGEYPKTSDATVLGSVITKCWNVEFSSMNEVLKSIEQYEGMRSSLLALRATSLT